MFVRVLDKKFNRYYKSMVYGHVNYGYDSQFIVVNPYTDCFELVDYLDKSGSELLPLVEIIQEQPEDEWVTYQNAILFKYKRYCSEKGREMMINYFSGYRDVYNDFDFLTAVIDKKSVPVSAVSIKRRQLSDTDVWNYVLTQDDANTFMEAFAGFHDSTLDRLVYEEDHRVTKITATFDNSGWYGIVELCFEGVLSINIRTSKKNNCRYIYAGTLLVNDETIFWADDYMERENTDYSGSYIKALNLKWRKVG